VYTFKNRRGYITTDHQKHLFQTFEIFSIVTVQYIKSKSIPFTAQNIPAQNKSVLPISYESFTVTYLS